IAGTAAAASGVLTVMRTSSEPACASSLTWIAVPIASAVSVFVMDCPRTGASPPIVTRWPPQRTSTACDTRRGTGPPKIGSEEQIWLLLSDCIERPISAVYATCAGRARDALPHIRKKRHGGPPRHLQFTATSRQREPRYVAIAGPVFRGVHCLAVERDRFNARAVAGYNFKRLLASHFLRVARADNAGEYLLAALVPHANPAVLLHLKRHRRSGWGVRRSRCTGGSNRL